MNLYLVVLVIGCAAILQGGLNSRLIPHLGLTYTVVLNNAVILLCSFGLLAVARWAPGLLPEAFALKPDPRVPGAWAAWPAVVGLLIVAGLPWAFSQTGALSVFILLVLVQLVAGQVWDLTVEGLPFSPWKAAGAAIAFLGVLVASKG